MSKADANEIKKDIKDFNKAFEKLSNENKSYVMGYMNGVASSHKSTDNKAVK